MTHFVYHTLNLKMSFENNACMYRSKYYCDFLFFTLTPVLSRWNFDMKGVLVFMGSSYWKLFMHN